MAIEQSNYSINIKLEHKTNTNVTIHCYLLKDYCFKYSARLEQPKKRNCKFYYAYKKIGGKLHKQYIGTSLNIKALEEVCLSYLEIARKNEVNILKTITNPNQELPNELPNEPSNQELPNQELPNQELPNQGLPNQELPNLEDTIAKAIELYQSKPKKSDKSSREIIQELISFAYNQDVEINLKNKK